MAKVEFYEVGSVRQLYSVRIKFNIHVYLSVYINLKNFH